MARTTHGGSLPVISSSSEEPVHSYGMTLSGSGTIVSSPAAAATLQQVPPSESELAEIRVSTEDLPNDAQSRLSAQ